MSGPARWKQGLPAKKPKGGRARPDEPLEFVCEARVDWHVCTGRAQTRHHKLRRGQGGGDERANTLDICNACHDWIHSNPAKSYGRGYLTRRGT